MVTPSPKRVFIGDIKSKLLKPALTTHYVVDIQPPETGFFTDRDVDTGATKRYDRITLGCVEASLPGSSLATIDIDNDFHGVSEKHAYRRIYDDRIDFTFFVDSQEYYIIRFFETWISYVVDEQRTDFDLPTYTYRVNFPSRSSKDKDGGYYAPNLGIIKFERDFTKSGSKGLKYQFINAFPISISSMPVSYEQSNLLKCTVSFSYSRYRLDDGYDFANVSETEETPTSPTSPFTNTELSNFFTNIPTDFSKYKFTKAQLEPRAFSNNPENPFNSLSQSIITQNVFDIRKGGSLESE